MYWKSHFVPSCCPNHSAPPTSRRGRQQFERAASNPRPHGPQISRTLALSPTGGKKLRIAAPLNPTRRMRLRAKPGWFCTAGAWHRQRDTEIERRTGERRRMRADHGSSDEGAIQAKPVAQLPERRERRTPRVEAWRGRGGTRLVSFRAGPVWLGEEEGRRRFQKGTTKRLAPLGRPGPAQVQVLPSRLGSVVLLVWAADPIRCGLAGSWTCAPRDLTQFASLFEMSDHWLTARCKCAPPPRDLSPLRRCSIFSSS